MIKITGEINLSKYEDGRVTTTLSIDKYDNETKEIEKDENGNNKKVWREIPIKFVKDAKQFDNCMNRAKVKINNGWLGFKIGKDKRTYWHIAVSDAELIEQGEGYKKPWKKAESEKKEEQEEDPFALGDVSDLPF